jgi:hypothetical protein
MSTFANSRKHLWPAKFRAKLRYVDARAISITGGAMAYYTYELNNLYDPDLTGVGHQPMGFDQLMGTTSVNGFYEHCYAENVELDLHATFAGSSNIPTVVGVLLSPESTLTPVEYEQMVEAGANYRILSLYDSKCNIKLRANVSKELGLGKDTSPLQCTNAAGPSRGLYAHVFVAPQDGAATDSYPGADITTSILFDTVFVAPRIPGQS